MTANLETASPAPSSRWKSLIWPRWLPVPARLPLVAQFAGAAALVAAIGMPRLTDVTPKAAVTPTAAVAPTAAAPPPVDVPLPASLAASVAKSPVRPAHLNLDVQHAFGNMDLSISVDGKRVFDTTLEGSAKRFGVFGRRSAKGFRKSLDLAPGVRVVRVRVRSASDKFDQTRVERFDLAPASVVGMTIAADKSGLSIVAERPPVVAARPPVAERPPVAAERPPVVAERPLAPERAPAAPVAPTTQESSALAELYQTLRSVLIAVAGVVASAATGVFVQEFLRSKKGHA